jgi:nitrogen-specific signal transduction histidine kinase
MLAMNSLQYVQSGAAAGPPGTAIDEEGEPSVLADFDTGYVLDSLSTGIVVLDQQLCAIYANRIAQDLLGRHLSSMRGRPLAHFLPQSPRFSWALRQAHESGAPLDDTLQISVAQSPEKAGSVVVRITPLRTHTPGAYVLLELGARAGPPRGLAAV